VSRVIAVSLLVLVLTVPVTAQERSAGDRYRVAAPGPIASALYSRLPDIPAADALPVGKRPVSPGVMTQEVPDPPLWHSVVYGLGAKILINYVLIDMAGDTFHALPSLLFIDPVVTAAGVHIGNDTQGSFFLDLLASYGSLYFFTTLAYGEFMPAGQFEDPTSYDEYWTSVGLQFLVTVVTEQVTGHRTGRLRHP